MSNPESRLRWLDLACGRGQVLGSLKDNLSADARARIEFWGLDVDQNFVRETERLAKTARFAMARGFVCELADFHNALKDEAVRFDFITVTNAVHELAPRDVATVLVDSVLRLSDAGTLFICDIEDISPPELGAISWRRDEVRQVIRRMLDELGVPDYRPEFALWHHRTSSWWGVQIERQHVRIPANDASAGRVKVIAATQAEIETQLQQKLALCRDALTTLTECGPETTAEQDYRMKLLFDYWALTHALGASP